MPGPRLAGKPVVVLTSPFTGSAAEEFAYDVQTHKLGTLDRRHHRRRRESRRAVPALRDHLAAFIATGRAINPVTKTNWEGVGRRARPRRAAGRGAARGARAALVQGLLEIARDPATRDRLGRALEQAKATPEDPPGEFERGPRRRAG